MLSVVFPKAGVSKDVKMCPPVCVLSALHRWIAVATADLLSKIRNGGGNGSEPLQSGSIQGALEGHCVFTMVKSNFKFF